jgi:endonuclease/exonuclease/phosphatase family metal-dependent hydrolase
MKPPLPASLAFLLTAFPAFLHALQAPAAPDREETRYRELTSRVERDPCFGVPPGGDDRCGQPPPLTLDELRRLREPDLQARDPLLYAKMRRRLETPLIRNFNPHAAPRSGPEANTLGVVSMNVARFRQFAGIKALLGDAAGLERSHLRPGAVLRAPSREKLRRVESADLYALTEADSGICRSGYHGAEELAIRLNLNIAQAMEWFEVQPGLLGLADGGPGCRPSEILPGALRNEQYNALLSRYPIRSARRVSLEECYDWFGKELQGETRRGSRSALIAEVEVTGLGTVAVVVSHLENKTTPGCRNAQLQQIDAALKQIERDSGRTLPVILAGDFNPVLGSERLLKDFAAGLGFRTDDAFSTTAQFNQSLDYIFARPGGAFDSLRLARVEVVREAGPPEFGPVTVPLSDHAAVIADVQFHARAGSRR